VVNCIVKTLFHFCDDGTDCVLVLLVCFYINFRNHYPPTDRFTAFVVLTRCFVNYFLLSGLYEFTQPGWALSLSLCFLGCMIFLCVHVCFVLPWSVESFPFVFWRWRNKLINEHPSSFLLPPHCCGLGAGSTPFRAIANNKQCEMRGLFMSLVIRY